jgi:glycosyltransferase involved in cell wall biosynthesis
VDIGIPVAHRTGFVGRAIESVLAQTFERWQLTVVEDGPETPQVRSALEPYLDDPRITYRPLGENVGPQRAKSRLIQTGSAPFVGLLDDDDILLPEFFERHVEFLENHPEVGLVFCANTVIDAEGRETGRAPLVLAEGVHRPGEFYPRLFAHNVAASPTILVRRTAYDAVGASFDSRLHTTYDHEMWLRIAARYPVGYRARWDASYRQHGDQSTIIDRGFRAKETLLLLDIAGEHVARSPERIDIPSEVQRKRRSSALLSVALDAVEAGEFKRSREALIAAARVSPRSLLDLRLPLAVTGMLLPRRARGLIGTARTFTLRHGLRGGQLQRRLRG